MNTKLPTCTMGIFAPRGPTPKLCTNVQMPLTNSADAIRMDVSSGPKPRPPAMSSGAGRRLEQDEQRVLQAEGAQLGGARALVHAVAARDPLPAFRPLLLFLF